MLCGAHVLNALQLLRLWQGQFARPACTEPCARAKRCYQRAGACNEFVPFLLLLPPLRSSHAYSVYAPTKHTPHLQTNLGVTRPPCKCQAVPSATHSTPSFKSPSLPPLSPPPAHSSPVFLMATSFLTTAVSLLLAAARLPALYPLSLAAGFGFGAHWSLMPSLASELFGLHHFATNYTMLQVGKCRVCVAVLDVQGSTEAHSPHPNACRWGSWHILCDMWGWGDWEAVHAKVDAATVRLVSIACLRVVV